MESSFISDNYSLLMVDRRGPIDDSHMITNDIIGHIEPNMHYEITSRTCIPTTRKCTCKDFDIEIPPYCEITDNWDNSGADQTYDTYNNILGNMGILSCDTDSIVIPSVVANDNNTRYYGAQLIQQGDIIQFDTQTILPITHMTIGHNYARHFLLNEDYGGGAYLEYHNTPHFHMPLNEEASGYLLLGKRVNEKIHLTAFTIPYGYAIYTPPGVIHCDGFLIGNYCVIYTITNNYSTVRLIHDNRPVNVKMI